LQIRISRAQFRSPCCITFLLGNCKNKVLAEVFRVLRPGGFFVGSDSLQNWLMRIIHVGDTFVPINPDTVGARLQSAGFEVLEVQKNSQAFRFRARRPSASPLRTRIGE